MKIFSAAQMRLADQATLKTQELTSLDLMERAATEIFNLIHERLQGAPIPIHVFCGLGKNGGDGLVISRLLVEHGYHVHTYIVNFSDNRSKEFLINYDRLKSMSKEWPTQLKSEEDFPVITPEDMVIDAIFGIGLNRSLLPWVTALLKHINAARCFTLAVDVPSGLYAHKAPDDPEGVIYADVAISFQLPKLVFFLPETAKYIQELEIITIGLDPDAIQNIPGEADLVGKAEVLPLYKPRQKFSHKGDYGHCMLIGGSYGKIGSIVLATEAAMRVGAGLATAYIPKCGYTVLQSSVPEAMVITDDEDQYIEDIEYSISPTAIGVGIGLGTHKDTAITFGKWLKKQTIPLVIDADGINLLAQDDTLLKHLPEQSILTPHGKELERLIGKWTDDFDKLAKVKEFSKHHKCIVIIKGAHTITISNDELYVNASGNPGMATAGSGDVLTGILTGLLSQGYGTVETAVFGVYLHGCAGDIAVHKSGYEAVLASDIVRHIGAAYLHLFEEPTPPPIEEEEEEFDN